MKVDEGHTKVDYCYTKKNSFNEGDVIKCPRHVPQFSVELKRTPFAPALLVNC